MADMPTLDEKVDQLLAEVAELRAEIGRLKAQRPVNWPNSKTPQSRVNAISASPYDLSQRRGLL